MTGEYFLEAIVSALLAGEPAEQAIYARLCLATGVEWRWLRSLARGYATTFGAGMRPLRRDVLAFVLRDKGFNRAARRFRAASGTPNLLAEAPVMLPAPAAAQWNVPAIVTTGELAQWLSISVPELAWFADGKGLERRTKNPRLRHYHYRAVCKSSGSLRLIEAPKPRLKEIQRRILDLLLTPIPAHPAAHGFVPGRSIRTFAAPHTGRHVVVRLDLKDFFPSIGRARVSALFRTAGYPEAVADLLAALCTNVTPHDAWPADAPRETTSLYRVPHLPQGAPSSPAVANLCAWRLDSRLAGLAASAGAEYTRYADDLAFSGGVDFARVVDRFATHAAVIAMEEGFAVHHRKTRVMRQGVRQHLAGIVTNQRPNVMRADFDRLKAILTNCVRRGPEGQNLEGHADFRAHLAGRVAFVEMIHAERGAKLRALFDRIRWAHRLQGG